MLHVTFIHSGQPRTFEIDPSSVPHGHHGLPGSLLEIALGVGVPLEHACGGSGACTTCHVIVRSGIENLSEMDDAEADRLDSAWGLTPESRLACRAVAHGDVVVEIPAYTRNYVQEGGGITLGLQTRR